MSFKRRSLEATENNSSQDELDKDLDIMFKLKKVDYEVSEFI